MKTGDYVRTKKGIIGKIKLVDDQTDLEDLYLIKRHWYYLKDIIKSSPNIIDLIEVGDYVNGFKVVWKDNNEFCINAYNEEEKTIKKEQKIKSIVTKEQFKAMEYRIGE